MQQGVQTDAKLVTSNNVASVCTGIDTYTGDYFQAFCRAKRAVISFNRAQQLTVNDFNDILRQFRKKKLTSVRHIHLKAIVC